MSIRIRVASALIAAVFVAFLCAQATGAAPIPPIPPLTEPLGSLLGGNPPAQTSDGAPAASSAQSAPASPAAVRAATTTSAATALERLVTAQINVVRHDRGLARLTVSPQLGRAGREHVQRLALAGYFSHDWSDGTPFGTWIRRFYPVGSAHRWSAGENLAWSTPEVTAQQAVEMWLASPEHRRILLSKTWRQVGLGVIRADGAGGVYDGQSVVILAAEFGIRR